MQNAETEEARNEHVGRRQRVHLTNAHMLLRGSWGRRGQAQRGQSHATKPAKWEGRRNTHKNRATSGVSSQQAILTGRRVVGRWREKEKERG